MLTIEYKYFTVVFPDNTNLQNAEPEILPIIDRIEQLLDNLQLRIKHQTAPTPAVNFTRINNTENLLVVTSSLNTVHVLYYDVQYPEMLSDYIPLSMVRALKNDYLLYDFEDKVRQIGVNRNITISNETLTALLKDFEQEYVLRPGHDEI